MYKLLTRGERRTHGGGALAIACDGVDGLGQGGLQVLDLDAHGSSDPRVSFTVDKAVARP